MSVFQINILKNLIAFILFSPVLLTLNFQTNLKEVVILLLSGVIGIAIGDSFYILSLKILGTRLTLTIESLSPIMATLVGSLFLQELLPLKVWLGVCLVSLSLIGVAFQETQTDKVGKSNFPERKGFVFALLSVICAVFAATLSRLVLTTSDLNPFQTTEIRLIGAIIALAPFVRKNLSNLILKLPFRNKTRILYATFFGTNMGILLQQNVFKILPIGLGWTLLSTSPALALLFARAEGEELNWKTLMFTATTILGVAIVFI